MVIYKNILKHHKRNIISKFSDCPFLGKNMLAQILIVLVPVPI